MNARLTTKLALGVLALCVAALAHALPPVGALFTLSADRNLPDPTALTVFGLALLVLGIVRRHRRSPGEQ